MRVEHGKRQPYREREERSIDTRKERGERTTKKTIAPTKNSRSFRPPKKRKIPGRKKDRLRRQTEVRIQKDRTKTKLAHLRIHTQIRSSLDDARAHFVRFAQSLLALTERA